MLTDSTAKLLNKMASESDSLYSEGGLLYRYSFGHRCAHADLSNLVGAIVENTTETIERFISSSVSAPFSRGVSPQVKQGCSELLSCLAKDFKGFQGPRVHIEGDDTSKKISLVYTANNDYQLLELFWSID